MARRSEGDKEVRRWQGGQEGARGAGGDKEVRRWQNYTSQGRLVDILQFTIDMYTGRYRVEKWGRHSADWVNLK